MNLLSVRWISIFLEETNPRSGAIDSFDAYAVSSGISFKHHLNTLLRSRLIESCRTKRISFHEAAHVSRVEFPDFRKASRDDRSSGARGEKSGLRSGEIRFQSAHEREKSSPTDRGLSPISSIDGHWNLGKSSPLVRELSSFLCGRTSLTPQLRQSNAISTRREKGGEKARLLSNFSRIEKRRKTRMLIDLRTASFRKFVSERCPSKVFLVASPRFTRRESAIETCHAKHFS